MRKGLVSICFKCNKKDPDVAVLELVSNKLMCATCLVGTGPPPPPPEGRQQKRGLIEETMIEQVGDLIDGFVSELAEGVSHHAWAAYDELVERPKVNGFVVRDTPFFRAVCAEAFERWAKKLKNDTEK
jgi:hypothetical protein